jgi:hypothetical protein
MLINLQASQLRELKPRIVVCGVGGAGGNAVNNMIASGLTGIDFVVANTDAQALTSSRGTLQLLATISHERPKCGAAHRPTPPTVPSSSARGPDRDPSFSPRATKRSRRRKRPIQIEGLGRVGVAPSAWSGLTTP